jgi:hypothetical protein
MAKAKKVVKKTVESKKEEFTDGMQDNVLINALIEMVKKGFSFESTPMVSYWPHSHSIDFHFYESGLDYRQIEKLANLYMFEEYEPKDGNPVYQVDIDNEVYDREKQMMILLTGEMEVKISMEFTKNDWEKMTKAERGSILNLEEDKK